MTTQIITMMFLGFVYWLAGFVTALISSCGIGFAFCVFVALFNIFRYKWAWALMLAYSAGAFICLLLILGLLYLAGTLGDHTGYKMQTFLLVGLVVPGIISLTAIPAFFKVAARRTRGLDHPNGQMINTIKTMLANAFASFGLYLLVPVLMCSGLGLLYVLCWKPMMAFLHLLGIIS